MSVELSSIDSINRLLANVLSTFPSFYTTRRNDKVKLQLDVISPLVTRSIPFCRQEDTNILSVSGGGWSTVGPFTIELLGENTSGPQKIKIASISFGSSSPGWKPYQMEVYAKKPTRQVHGIKENLAEIKMGIERLKIGQQDVVVYVSTDVVHESIIGGLVSHLFDMGLAPSLMKYLGVYVCPYLGENIPPSVMKPQILFEKSNIEFLSLLGGLTDNSGEVSLFKQTTGYDYIIWLIQIAHSLFVMKYHFGISHFDMHLRNVMLTYVKSTGNTLKWGDNPLTELTYDKKDLKDAAFYMYELSSGNRILVENNGFLPKIIDFGLSSALFGLSVENSDIPIAFRNLKENYAHAVQGLDALDHIPGMGDVDYNFFALNLMFQIDRTIKHAWTPYGKDFELKNKMLDLKNGVLGKFLDDTIPDVCSRENCYRQLDDNKTWLMRARKIGTTPDISAVLKRIWDTLARNTPVQYVDGKGYSIVTRDGRHIKISAQLVKNAVYVPFRQPRTFSMSNLDKFLQTNKDFWRSCILDTSAYPSRECGDVRGEPNFDTLIRLEKYNPNSRLKTDFFSNILDSNVTDFWDGEDLRNGIKMRDLRHFKRFSMGRGAVSLYTLRFLPKFTNMQYLEKDESLSYSQSQRDTSFQPPKSNEQMDTVNMHLVYIQNPPGYTDFEKHHIAIGVEQRDLFEVSIDRLRDMKQGVSINGGYFIVPGNISNPLTPGLEKFKLHPIGYFFSKQTPEYNGTKLPIPRAYSDSFATIYIDSVGRLHMMKSSEFLNHHKTVSKIVLVSKNDPSEGPRPNIIRNEAITQKVIDMTLTSEGIYVPTQRDIDYVSAFETGPILIWNGDIVFTRAKMEFEEFTMDTFDRSHPSLNPRFERYRVSATAQNYKMWFNEPGESNFIYGARHSNSLGIHNVLCITKDNEYLIVFIEGRGFDAAGLDRAQLAELISKFNVKHAVALDGGFSANAVFKNPPGEKAGTYWLLNDPEKRSISTAIHFGIKNDAVGI